MDMLVAFWAIAEKPTGSKDPFALRRAALGVIRLILENQVRTGILPVIINHMQRVMHALDLDPGPINDLAHDLLSFIHNRLTVHLRDEGIRHDVIAACVSLPEADNLLALVNRARALNEFLATDDGKNLIQGFRRAHSILMAEQTRDGVEYSFGADPKLTQDPSEVALFEALEATATALNTAQQARDDTALMVVLATLRTPIDEFFESIQVNTDNAIIRRNRLNLLHQICALCGTVADMSKIVTPGDGQLKHLD